MSPLENIPDHGKSEMILLMKLVFLCCCSKRGLVSAFTLQDEANLQASILAGYNKDLKPGWDRDVPLQINIMFFLFSIKEFDFNTGKLSVTGVFFINWTDERLAWDPTNHNHTYMTTIPQNKLWLPEFINVNPYDDLTGLRQDRLTIHLQYSGMCAWFAIQSFEVVCNADVTKYPFDIQTCALRFYVWGYYSHEIDLVISSSEIDLSLYVENSIWEIRDATIYLRLDYWKNKEIIVKLEMKRRSPYYVVSLIIPIIAVSFLMAFVFILPHDSGERVGFSTTVLLSIIVYLTIIQDLLPESSEPNISALGYLFVTYVVSGAFVVVEVIITLRFHRKSSENPVPRCLRCILIFFRRKRRKNVSIKPIDTCSKTYKTDNDENGGDENNEVQWGEVLTLFDTLCFIFTLFVFFMSALIYLCVVLT